jgi:hypothetical protein
VPVVEDVFDSSAAERVTAKQRELRALLASAENGWLVDYYPDKQAARGGYAMHVRFHADGVADVVCERETFLPAGEVATSEYDILSDQSVVLSFNTYNKVMHFFSEPSASDVDGWAGDYEFILRESTSDKIEMVGKKWGRRLVMRRCDPAFDFQAYIDDVLATADLLSAFGMFAFQSNGEVLFTATVVDRTFDVSYQEINGTDTVEVTAKIPYIITDKGVRFYEPFTRTDKGVTIENFEWNNTDEKYVCVDPGKSVEGVIYFPADYELKYAEIPGKWILEYRNPNALQADTVEITQKKKNATYTLSCPKIFMFPFELTFVASKGTISLLTQALGFYEPTEHNIRATAYYYTPSTGGGNYYQDIGTRGLRGVWNHDEGGTRKITLVNNGTTTAPVGTYFGLTLRTFDKAGTYVGTFTANPGGYRFTELVLTKIDD